MPELLTRNRTSPIAVDFGACSLRGAQLIRKAGGWHVYHWFNVETDPVSADPPRMDYGAHLKMAMGPGAFAGRRVAFTLAPPDLEYRLIDLPSALLTRKAAELKEALQFELDRQLPWPAKDTEMAAWPVGAANGPYTSTMVAAVRTSAIQATLDLLQDQDLECVLADVTPNAIIRLHEQAPGRPGAAGRRAEAAADNVVWGALDIGFRACRLYLMHNGRPVFARVLRGGGRELTELLARGLHVEFAVAEQYKRLYGIQRTDRGLRSVVGGLGRISEEALPGMLYAVLARTLETLVVEIEKSYRFVLDRTPSAVTGGLYLLGGGARLKGLAEILGQRLGIEVRLPDPAAVIRNAKSSDAVSGPDGSGPADGLHPACAPVHFPALAVCMGLAMREEFA
jgi:type IV pilus assembly protein PilM